MDVSETVITPGDRRQPTLDSKGKIAEGKVGIAAEEDVGHKTI
jgi:hypothetical protein